MANLLGLAARANGEDASSELSSSSISSPPISPQQAEDLEMGDNIIVRRTPLVPRNAQRDGVVNASSATPVLTASSSTTIQPDKPKRQRKKKELGPDGKPIDDGKPKEKKPRKPREPKDKAATTANPRKKVKLEDKSAVPEPVATKKFNLFDVLTPKPPAAPAAAASSTNASPAPSAIKNLLQPSNAAPRPASSGQRFDPVRAAMMEAMGVTNTSQPTTVHRASASPSIASLIDPPTASDTTTPAALRSPQPSSMQTLLQASPAQHTTSFATRPTPASPSPAIVRTTTSIPNSSDVMEVDSNTTSFTALPKDEADLKVTAKPASAAPTPKPPAPRSSPSAAKGTGSGLLSTSDLIGGSSSNGVLERKGVTIDIVIPLNPNGSNHINLAQEIIKKYGRDALYPRAAAHREDLLSAMHGGKNAGAGSADDMSLDLNSDMEDDSNIEMGGMDDTADGEKSRKRRKKVEEYDLDDEFIDDTELAWQQQAAVAKDGFFVYSGPLRSESEKAAAEAASSSTRGGRGRGRGRGRGGAGATHASLAEKKEPTAATALPTSVPARGKGSRGGRVTGAARKPRVTKVDKEKLDAEKAERERSVPGMLAAASNAVSASPARPPAAQIQQNGVTTA